MVYYSPGCPTLFEFLYLIALLIMVLIGAKLLVKECSTEEYLKQERKRLKKAT